MKKLLIIISTFIIILFQNNIIFNSNVYSHDFNTKAFAYILEKPESTLDEFIDYLKIDLEPGSEVFETAEEKLLTILSLPGKKYVVNYVRDNLDFKYNDIKNLIKDDPMLSEI